MGYHLLAMLDAYAVIGYLVGWHGVGYTIYSIAGNNTVYGCGIWQTPELLSRTACGDRNHAEALGVDETTVICMSRTSGLMRTLGRVQAACFTLSTCMHIIGHAVGLAWGWGELLWIATHGFILGTVICPCIRYCGVARHDLGRVLRRLINYPPSDVLRSMCLEQCDMLRFSSIVLCTTCVHAYKQYSESNALYMPLSWLFLVAREWLLLCLCSSSLGE